MKVVTLSEKKFSEHCSQLIDMVVSDGYIFDSVIGIATGGLYVVNGLNISENIKKFEVKLQRKTTKFKRGILQRILRRFPEKFNNVLRIIEFRIYELGNKFKRDNLSQVYFSDEIQEYLLGGHRKLLIVDDAVDSGATIRSVIFGVKNIAPQTEIRIAVITVTRNDALQWVNYYIYGDNTILRFPWSKDMKK